LAGVSLKLLLLKSEQRERLRTFYQSLGVELGEELHGIDLVCNGVPSQFAGQLC
jgi:hypothetical protein